jgi:hypothetical protein
MHALRGRRGVVGAVLGTVAYEWADGASEVRLGALALIEKRYARPGRESGQVGFRPFASAAATSSRPRQSTGLSTPHYLVVSWHPTTWCATAIRVGVAQQVLMPPQMHASPTWGGRRSR